MPHRADCACVIYFFVWNCKKESALPLYEYQCVKCGRRTEKIESVSGPHLKRCPHCGGKVEALISAPAIQFKGSGWYVTDYAGKKPDSEGGSGKDEKSGTASKEAAAKDSSAKDSSKEKKTEKPAKKK
jgi:putative FmdB family regulatory protein